MKAKIIVILAIVASTVWADQDKQALKLAFEMQSAVLTLQDTNKVAELLKQGANVNAPIGCGTFSPLDGAISTHNVEMLKFLLQKGAKPFGRELVEAAFYDNSEQSLQVCKILLAAGVNPNVRDQSAASIGTPLGAAAYRGNVDVVVLLLSQPDIKLNETDADGYTALMWAVQHDEFDIADMLLKAGASVQPVNRFGDTAITIAQKENAQQQVMISKLKSVAK
jgi:ankyrin repeat protein